MAARGCFWLRCVMTYAVFSFTSTRGKRLRCGLPWKPYLVCERVWLTRASNVLREKAKTPCYFMFFTHRLSSLV